ncbi:hypothetical protein P43SY_000125 [Pythium insidiosum]|uniref:protein-ribulosamine 3-kinase n=1 Tax=Pythium insidiosum TaxID=114742 RepID=A0AAD5LH35_PYTIN|nr:hypothetical protein P43SY_000125 [Pythium insidiosum]
MASAVRGVIATLYGQAPRSVRREHGGSISECFVVELDGGESARRPARVFVKLHDDEQVLRAEAAGLEAMQATRTVRVPAVLHVGAVGNTAYLVLEFLALRGQGSWSALGAALAALHTATGPDRFGFETDNFLGRTPQNNAWEPSWIEFFRARLAYQLDRLVESGVCSAQADRAFLARVEAVSKRLDCFFDPHEKITPSLLHGDLWQGNWGFLALDGTPVVFDPAAYYGHHEAELAMMTLFGDPPQSFFDAYFAVIPKALRFEERVPLYQLYHGLNHMNLFGRSYQRMCDDLLSQLEAR